MPDNLSAERFRLAAGIKGQQIGKEIARILSLPDIRERLESAAYQITPTTPDEHDRNLRADIAAFAKVFKDIGLNLVC